MWQYSTSTSTTTSTFARQVPARIPRGYRPRLHRSITISLEACARQRYRQRFFHLPWCCLGPPVSSVPPTPASTIHRCLLAARPVVDFRGSHSLRHEIFTRCRRRATRKWNDMTAS